MHTLYGCFSEDQPDVTQKEKALLSSIDKVYDLFLWYGSVFAELQHLAEQEIEAGLVKFVPSYEDLNPNRTFAENSCIKKLAHHKAFTKAMKDRAISWSGDQEIIRQIWQALKEEEHYAKYMSNSARSDEADRSFLVDLSLGFFHRCEPLQFFLEEKSIQWIDDHEAALTALAAFIKKIKVNSENENSLPPLYKDSDDDKRFVLTLFRKTLLDRNKYDEAIASKTKNWELDRIAMLDIVLLKMAITEVLAFENIPVKVTMNEYIEIAKQYSTPKSQVFINGVLDSLFMEMKASGQIKKTGRGLVN